MKPINLTTAFHKNPLKTSGQGWSCHNSCAANRLIEHPTLKRAIFKAHLNALIAAISVHDSVDSTANFNKMMDAMRVVQADLHTLAVFYNTQFPHDEQQLLLTGLPFTVLHGATEVTKVTGVTVRRGENAGELLVGWPWLRGNNTYAILLSTDPDLPMEEWRMIPVLQWHERVLRGLTSGVRYYIVVTVLTKAITERGDYLYSNPVDYICQ